MRKDLQFPIIKKAELRYFSLYSRQSIITANLIDGAFCLVGANGLGKSTFLSTLNYALTGIVSDPKRKFESVDEFFYDSMKFSSEYFDGRVDESDRNAAEIMVELEFNNKVITLTRGIFDTEELRELFIYDKNKRAIIRTTEELTTVEKNELYKEIVTENVGLSSFPQFVFLQHFVLTFDESRRLLFWDQKVLEHALYIAFGVSDDHAKRAEKLRRDIEKADSLGRNFRWQATEIQKKVKDIESALTVQTSTNPEFDNIVDIHKKMLDSKDSVDEELYTLENKIRDSNMLLSEKSAAEAVLRNKYNEIFYKYTGEFPGLIKHPLVSQSIDECKCGLCGSTGVHLVENIKKSIEKTCPLCQSELVKNDSSDEHFEQLQKIDLELLTTRDKISEILQTKERLDEELSKKKNEQYRLQQEIEVFERSNEEVLQHLRRTENSGNDIQGILKPLKLQIEGLLHRRDEEYKKRNKSREQLKVLQQELEKQYAQAEIDFVPLFKDLAFRFIGIDLDIVMETKSRPGVSLLLEVKNVTRRQQHTLSESQRFFIDIALRMALTQYITRSSGNACLFIDTPEGSLDIAYESRAGDMLSRFVENRYKIIMTANINSSRLLIRLAEECGSEYMYLCRMTSWTDLSEVQVSEEDLFEQAYSAIEKAMKKRRSDHDE